MFARTYTKIIQSTQKRFRTCSNILWTFLIFFLKIWLCDIKWDWMMPHDVFFLKSMKKYLCLKQDDGVDTKFSFLQIQFSCNPSWILCISDVVCYPFIAFSLKNWIFYVPCYSCFVTWYSLVTIILGWWCPVQPGQKHLFFELHLTALWLF